MCLQSDTIIIIITINITIITMTVVVITIHHDHHHHHQGEALRIVSADLDFLVDTIQTILYFCVQQLKKGCFFSTCLNSKNLSWCTQSQAQACH